MIADALSALRSALPSNVSLVAVSKFHPVERLMEAYQAGQRIFAESRPQELFAKVPQMPADVQWHFIGHLQTNKLKLVLPFVSLVQSVDSFRLLKAISDWGDANHHPVDILLELHLGAEETKQGFTEAEILALISGEGWGAQTSAHPRPDKREGPTAVPVEAPRDGRGREATACASHPSLEMEMHVRHYPGVRIRGLMGMATNTDDRSVVERDFERIEHLFHQIQEMELPHFDQLSIGMSADWPIAVKHGATMVRIGTDIFGPREY